MALRRVGQKLQSGSPVCLVLSSSSLLKAFLHQFDVMTLSKSTTEDMIWSRPQQESLTTPGQSFLSCFVNTEKQTIASL